MRLGLIGAGNMASALARGIGEPVLVHDVDRAKAEALAEALGGEAVGSNAELAERADVVVLCHKPKQLAEVAAEIETARVVISILAATTTEQVSAAYPAASIYRFIPNMPTEVGRGVLCYVPGPGASEGPEDEILALMGRAGAVIPLGEEPLIEPAMALMSCGPAFMALVVQSLADAGECHGLDAQTAARLVVETMAGTAAYLDANDLDAAELRHRVATPGGVTERGLAVLEDRGVPAAMGAAVDLVVESTR
jgi:pyrroline-5-carboxylate reductase